MLETMKRQSACFRNFGNIFANSHIHRNSENVFKNSKIYENCGNILDYPETSWISAFLETVKIVLQISKFSFENSENLQKWWKYLDKFRDLWKRWNSFHEFHNLWKSWKYFDRFKWPKWAFKAKQCFPLSVFLKKILTK